MEVNDCSQVLIQPEIQGEIAQTKEVTMSHVKTPYSAASLMTLSTRRRFLTGAAAVGLAGAMAGGHHSQASARISRQEDSQPRRGGTITAAAQNDWLTFDSALNTAYESTHHMLYDLLFFFEQDEDGAWAYTPGLVESWELGDENAIFHLRQGVQFHDGSDWNSDVLAWNIDRFINEPQSVAKGVMGKIDWEDPTTIIDEHTLQVNLTGPAPSLLRQFSDPTTYMQSKAAFEELGADQFGETPVGTGPFKFLEWRKNDRVELVRNENYWMTDANGEQLPYLDGITYRLIIDDSVRMLEMKAGSIDFTDLIQGKDVEDAKADPNLVYLEADWVGNAYRLIFNAQGGKFYNNPQLRQAALYAINREALAQALGAGIGVAEKYFPRPGSIGYDESLPYYSYDPDMARQLLSEAGYPDGIEVQLLVIARALDTLQAEMLKAMFDDVGIRTTVEVLERVALNQRLLTGGEEFDFTTTRGPSIAGDPDLEYREHFWTHGFFAKARLSDPEIDAAIEAASGTYDEAERAEQYKELQRLLFDKAVYGFLWTQKWNWVMNNRAQDLPAPVEQLWDFRPVSVTE